MYIHACSLGVARFRKAVHCVRAVRRLAKSVRRQRPLHLPPVSQTGHSKMRPSHSVAPDMAKTGPERYDAGKQITT